MQKFNFDFIKAGEPIHHVSGLMLDLKQAKNHCRTLYESVGRSVGADGVRVRENDGPLVAFSWPAGSSDSGHL